MNIALWVIQGLVAFAFFGAGGFKLFTPKAKLEKNLSWTRTTPAAQIKLLALAEVLGAVGVVVPWATQILPVLTPVAAGCLAIIMVGGTVTHVRHKESPAPTLILLVLCLAIAVGRGLALAHA